MKEVKQVLISNLLVTYSVEGTGEPIILLHGWGSRGEVFAKIQGELAKTHRVYALDFPGFGASEEPIEEWGCNEYALLVNRFLTIFLIEKPIVIGHSFGGRIAIVLSSQTILKKLVLTGSAGLIVSKENRKGIRRCFFDFAKALQKVIPESLSKKFKEKIIQQIGSADYKVSSSQMREILKKVISEDLTDYVANIKIPTLLIWGDADTATPLDMAKSFNHLIKGSRLIIMPNTGHYAFLDNADFFLETVKEFIDS